MTPPKQTSEPGNADQAEQPESTSPLVAKEVGRVRAQDVDTVIRIRDADARLQRLDTLVGAWTAQQNEERALRKTYATALIVLLAAEVVGIFVAFFLVGFGVLTVEKWMAQIFLVTAFVQSASLVVVVVKYLFPQRGSDLVKLIEMTAISKQTSRRSS